MLEDVGEVELSRLVVVFDLVQLLDQPAAVEAVDADVEFMHAGPLLGGRILPLDDVVEPAVAISNHSAIVPRGIFDRSDGCRGRRFLVGVEDLQDAGRGQERGVAVDHQHLTAAQLSGRDLLQSVRGALRIALVDHLHATVEVGGHVGLVGVRDHDNVLRAGLVDGFDDPVDHRAPADGMEDFGNPGPHSGAVARGEDDSSQGCAQVLSIMPVATDRGRSITFLWAKSRR